MKLQLWQEAEKEFNELGGLVDSGAKVSAGSVSERRIKLKFQVQPKMVNGTLIGVKHISGFNVQARKNDGTTTDSGEILVHMVDVDQMDLISDRTVLAKQNYSPPRVNKI